MKKKYDKSHNKKSSEELALYMHFKKRGFFIQNKKGKGSYKRNNKIQSDE